jgi:hypothetical protein
MESQNKLSCVENLYFFRPVTVTVGFFLPLHPIYTEKRKFRSVDCIFSLDVSCNARRIINCFIGLFLLVEHNECI